MTYTIAVSGKGGTGKTTLCGMLIKYLLDTGKKPILAVDADSNANLNEVLGVAVKSTIGEARELMKGDVPTGMSKEMWFEYKVNEALIEANGYDLLVMGRPEGPGCYCAANTLARKYIDILSDNYRYVVIDNEAGMEHLSRLTTQNVSLLIIISDPSRRGVSTAGRIRDLVLELNLDIGRSVLIVNRAPGDLEPAITQQAEDLGLELAGTIPSDETIFQFDSEGKPTFGLPVDSQAVQSARKIFDDLIQ
ncbi:MAG: AAA family ATPase [Proteobacteria bacterium]|nr:AAA family ATPase [Pseudomonadota bacterium]